ncbi:MAG: cupredoxin domain-containing protein [Nitrososphaeraceae archaeon]
MLKNNDESQSSSVNVSLEPNSGKAKIILTSHKYIERNDSAFNDIVGQVKNIGNGSAESVEIIFTYYDNNGDIVGTDNTYVNIQKLNPGQKAPFSQFMDRNTTIGMTNYEISLKWNNADDSEEYIENADVIKEEKKPLATSREKGYSNSKQLLSDTSNISLVNKSTSQYIGEDYNNRSKSIMLSDQIKIIPSTNQTTQDNKDTKKWLEYTSPIYDFSLEYPDNWKVVEGNRFMNIPGLIVPVNVNTTNINTVFANYTNYDNGLIIFGEVPISLTSLSAPELNKQISELILKQFNQNSENGFSNWKIFEMTPTKQINGNNVISAIFLVGDPVKDKSSLVLESLFIPYYKKLLSFIFIGTPDSFDQSNVLENRKHVFNSIKPSNNNNNKNNNLSSDSPLQEGKEFLNLQNDLQLNVPDKGTTQQQQTNTTISESTELQHSQQITEVTLTILEGSSIQGNPNFDPDELTVNKGDKILVDNVDTMPHTVTNGESGSDPNSGKIFDTSIINGGDSAKIDTSTIDTGSYPFYCTVHPYMTGTLTVE